MEAIELAIALSDVAHCCTNMVCWVASEAKETICDFAKMLRNDSLCPIKDFAFLVGKVMNDIAEAMLHADSESLGWSYYAQVLEDEHCYDAQYAQQVIDTIKFWVENSSAEEKTKAATRFVIDFALYGRYFKMLSHAGRTCSSLIAQTPEIRFLESFADVYAEHKLAKNLGDVGLNSMEDVGASLVKSEAKAVVEKSEIFLDTANNVIKTINKPASKCKIFQDISVKDFKEKFEGSDKLIKIIENRRSFTENGANGVANNVNGKKLLMKKLQIVEDFEQIAVEKKFLPDGRIRYYEMETPAATAGPTRGSGMVVEHDVKRGKVRAWYESRDHQGKVNRVNPKFIHGQEVFSQHYPPIVKDLKFFEVNPKKR